MTLEDMPDLVRARVAQLSREQEAESIWLVGSQVNGGVDEASDWDLVVFCSRDPVESGAATARLDVVLVGPSGQFVLAGQPWAYRKSFEDWQWEERGSEAFYVGFDLKAGMAGLEMEAGVSMPVLERRRAALLWRRQV